MKVSPQPQPQPALLPQRPAAVAAEPSGVFRSLLDETPDPQGDGAKAFSEGGLLGQTDSREAISSDVIETDPETSRWLDASGPFQRFEPPAQKLVSATVNFTTPEPGRDLVIQSGAGPATPAQRRHGAAGLGGAPIFPAANMRLSTGNRSVGALPAKPVTVRPARSRTSLVITSADGGNLSVVAAAPGLDREAATRLRRLMSELAVQFGFELGALQLNGLQIEKPFIGSTGGPHGH